MVMSFTGPDSWLGFERSEHRSLPDFTAHCLANFVDSSGYNFDRDECKSRVENQERRVGGLKAVTECNRDMFAVGDRICFHLW
jgi:hypothetical protein